MLHNPDRHETLLDIPWSVSGVRSTIDRIVENGVTTLDNEVRYHKHPRDEELEDRAGMSHYIGTGGVLWALDYLSKERDAAVDESWLIANLTAVAEYMEAVFNKTPLAADVTMICRLPCNCLS
ncbi:MAG: hypothetical protein CMP98_07745 [Gammaproteobacteria bacterium]|nr:hypothetical protein [Gammaproteobacteria bacterium]OUU09366.1 MAG: hypothetical protein CBB94_07905 [Gammaproteobacteria bacterium TMED34]|tara:strand:+ start:137 stop:505 length:369 start_codon:yes stop_codon:yes gene_type:complete